MRKTAAGRPSSPSDQGPASFRMAAKHHPTPLSGGDRKALKKELGKARAMTGILAAQSDELLAASPLGRGQGAPAAVVERDAKDRCDRRKGRSRAGRLTFAHVDGTRGKAIGHAI